jgi:putative heme-binding domain-containing protein
MRGSLAGADFLGHRILWWKIHPAGSTFELDLGGELFSANDTWSSPTDLAQGPDGSVYVSDFYDRRTAHPDPDAEWDRSNGRIYQIQPLGAHSSPLDLTIRTNSELIRLLEDNHAWYRRRAAAELVARNDRSILPEVHQLFRSQVVRDTLEASWLLHSMDALDESMLQQMLEHSRDEVRSWGVRLAGDRKTISSGISGILESMARQDDSIHVRSQLVATAGRLSHETGISILVGWMDRDVDQRDPFVPWRAWWSLEKHCTTSPLELISQMTQGKRPQKNSFRENLLRLARRYASGSGNNDVELDERLGEACATILRSNANEIPTEWLESVSLGLSERGKRSGGMGMGNLYETYAVRSSEVTPSAVRPANSLAVFLEQLWRADSGNLLKTRLAIQSGCDDAERAAIDNASDPQLPESSRLHWIESVTRFGASDCSSQAMSLYLHVEESAAIRRAALSLLEKQLSLENGQKLLATYSQVSPPLRADIRRLLLRRPNTANLLLSKVEAGAIAHQEFSLDELRHLANFQDRQLDRILRRYWGSLQPGTQEEKLAEIRRLNNDLRAGSGDPANGAKLFRDHCSVCHIRDGQGGRVGPELTNINRDRDALLVSIVDPSSTIRPEYVSSTVLLDDESIVSGIVQSKNDSQLVLLDAQGRLQTLSLAKIRELKESTASIMPERLLNKLTPQELRDLFALLQSAPSQEK